MPFLAWIQVLQGPLRHFRAGEVAADHLPLDGEPQMAVAQRPSGLCQHDEVRRAATTANRAAATMEEGDVLIAGSGILVNTAFLR